MKNLFVIFPLFETSSIRSQSSLECSGVQSIMSALILSSLVVLFGTAAADFAGFGTGVGGYCIKGGDAGRVWGVGSLDECYRRCYGSPAECASFVWGWGKCFNHPFRCDYQQLLWADSGFRYYERRQGPTPIGQSGETFYYNPTNNNDWGSRYWNRWFYKQPFQRHFNRFPHNGRFDRIYGHHNRLW